MNDKLAFVKIVLFQVLSGPSFDFDPEKVDRCEYQEVVKCQQEAAQEFTCSSTEFLGGEESALIQDWAADGQRDSPLVVPTQAIHVPAFQDTEEDLILRLDSDSEEPSGEV